MSLSIVNLNCVIPSDSLLILFGSMLAGETLEPGNSKSLPRNAKFGSSPLAFSSPDVYKISRNQSHQDTVEVGGESAISGNGFCA